MVDMGRGEKKERKALVEVVESDLIFQRLISASSKVDQLASGKPQGDSIFFSLRYLFFFF